MKYFVKFFVLFLSIFFCLSTFAQIAVQNQISPLSYQALPFIKMQSHKFKGGICYRTIKTTQPDMITFITSMPEHMTIPVISNCLDSLTKAKSELTPSDTGDLVDVLRTARTENMSCTIVGQTQTPMLYQVRFVDLSLTGKGPELKECMSAAAEAKNKAAYGPVERPTSHL